MSLQEAYERVEKLKNLAASSNPHEAALAASRLKAFDIHAVRYPKRQEPIAGDGPQGVSQASKAAIEILDEMPEVPYTDLGEIEVEQPTDVKKVNWEDLHAELRERAESIGADVLVNIQLKGTVKQRILCATALRYLSPVEIAEIKLRTKFEDDEKAYHEEQKERRDEANAPPID